VFNGREFFFFFKKIIKIIFLSICFSFFWDDGKYHSQYHSPIVGDRLFSVDYANNSLFVVNGPVEHKIDIAGYTFDMKTGDVTSTFGTFHDPHDIAVTSDGHEVNHLLTYKTN
jgi:hypothetical protein